MAALNVKVNIYIYVCYDKMAALNVKVNIYMYAMIKWLLSMLRSISICML